MFKDVVKLIKVHEVSDGAGGYETNVESERTIFGDKKSVKQTEFYLAAQSDLQVESIFTINKLDYQDEKILIHEDKTYSVVRLYERGDYIELTCQRRIGGLDEILR